MKKILIVIALCALGVSLVYAASIQIKDTAAGHWIGTTVSQKIGFFGATPVVRQTVTNTPPAPITIIWPATLGTANAATGITVTASTATPTLAVETATPTLAVETATPSLSFVSLTITDKNDYIVNVVTGITLTAQAAVTGAVLTAQAAVTGAVLTAQAAVTGIVSSVQAQSVLSSLSGATTNVISVLSSNQFEQLNAAGRNLGLWSKDGQ